MKSLSLYFSDVFGVYMADDQEICLCQWQCCLMLNHYEE